MSFETSMASTPSIVLPLNQTVQALSESSDKQNVSDSLSSEFESVFMSLLIKTMRSSLTEEGLFGSESSDTYGGLFDLYMGKHLAASKGLGIAQMMQSYRTEIQSNELGTSEKPAGTIE